MWSFLQTIKTGDIVALPLKGRNAIALGEVIGDYQYLKDGPPDGKHTRHVKWLVQDMSRDKFDQDLLYSLGAFSTVCRITRNNAEERIRALLNGTEKEAVPSGRDFENETLIGSVVTRFQPKERYI